MAEKRTDAGAIASRMGELEERVTRLEGLMRPSGLNTTSHASKRVSAKEFLMTKRVQSELQRVVALAFYLERQEGLASFNVADLENAFRSARERVPKNMNDAVNKNIARGFLMEAAEKKDSKKAWQLTATGERFVDTEMNL